MLRICVATLGRRWGGFELGWGWRFVGQRLNPDSVSLLEGVAWNSLLTYPAPCIFQKQQQLLLAQR